MNDKITLPSKEIISQEFYDKLMSVTGKRARFVIDTIIDKGSCSTEDLKDAGYEHAPRAKRDVVEAGIPIDNDKGVDRSGRRMAVYKLGDWEQYKKQNLLAKTKGRNNLTDKLKQQLILQYGARCALYGEDFSEALLQTDHRVPFEIGGDPEDMLDISKFMLLSPSANRAKSWACEHCVNWMNKDVEFCKTCYYASPEQYEHVSGKSERRLDILFTEADVSIYDMLIEQANINQISAQEEFKRIARYVQSMSEKLQ